MKYRGFDPRTRLLRWGLLVVTLGVVLGATGPGAAAALANAAAAQHDKLPWYATRLVAWLSYLAIAASVVYGLLLSTKILDAIAHRPISFTLHQDLGSIGLGLAGVHAMLLTLDRSVPYSLSDVLVPFAGPYRPLWVGLGQISLYLTLIVVASFYVRRRIGQRAWRMLHGVTFLAFAGAAAHGVMSGTDTATAWAWWAYAVPIALVVFLTAYRVVLVVADRLRRRRANRLPTQRAPTLQPAGGAAMMRPWTRDDAATVDLPDRTGIGGEPA
jgi:predicted ferric reductase